MILVIIFNLEQKIDDRNKSFTRFDLENWLRFSL